MCPADSDDAQPGPAADWPIAARDSDTSHLSLDAIGTIVSKLYAAYVNEHRDVSLEQFRDKLLGGVAVWEDLDLGIALRALPQLREICGGAFRPTGPIRTKQLQKLLDRMLSLTMEDGLTGLFNRRYFDHRLQQEIQRARRDHLPCSVMLVDVDDFKQVNDQHGHDVGDRVLRHISSLLKNTLRVSDEITARFGGEEFAILLPNTSAKQVPAVAERVRARIAAAPVPVLVGSGRLSISVGVSTFTPPGTLSADELLKQADVALYAAKQAGKNAVRCFPGDQHGDGSEGVSTAEREALFK